MRARLPWVLVVTGLGASALFRWLAWHMAERGTFLALQLGLCSPGQATAGAAAPFVVHPEAVGNAIRGVDALLFVLLVVLLRRVYGRAPRRQEPAAEKPRQAG